MQILQTTPPQCRRRGIFLTPPALKKLREAIKVLEYQDNFGKKYTLEELGERTGLDPVTIARVLEGERGVDKRTLERCFRAFDLELDNSDYTKAAPKSESPHLEISSQCTAKRHSHQDLREAVDVPVFHGRAAELALAKQWILSDLPQSDSYASCCRVVAILGMGGIGKTAFAAKLVKQIGQQFDYVIWKSLRHAPLPQEVIWELLQFLCQSQQVELPQSLGSGINLLLKCLYDCSKELDHS